METHQFKSMNSLLYFKAFTDHALQSTLLLQTGTKAKNQAFQALILFFLYKLPKEVDEKSLYI